MSSVLIALHILVCIVLVAVVLLQRGKGAEIGAVFGGGASSTVFGSRGAGNFLTKLTTISAIVFMCTSFALSYVWSSGSREQLFEEGVVEQETATDEPLFEEFGTVQPEAPAEGEAPAAAPDAPEAPATP